MRLFFRARTSGRATKMMWLLAIILVQLSLVHLLFSRRLETVGAGLDENKFTPMMHHRTMAKRCEEPAPKDEDLEFLSQDGEDKQLMAWFRGLCGGTYIEMGALNGRMFSNSFVFNQGFGWKGVLIEANPVAYKVLLKNRPNELALINSAVCDEPRTVHWVNTDHAPIGGIFEFADEEFANRRWSGKNYEKIPINCVPFGQLLDQHSPTQYFDFLSLDVEGGEYFVLSKLDFNRYAFGIVLVETGDHLKSLTVRSHLEANGYSFLMNSMRSDWFYNKQFGHIYKDLAHPGLSK
jgi:FkbM family methyltransferase